MWSAATSSPRPSPPGSFDAALSQCAFFLTGDVPAAFRAAYSLLRPGGVFMYSDIVPGGVEALRALAENAGFSLVSIEDITPQWREFYIRALWQGAAEPPPKERISGAAAISAPYSAAPERRAFKRRTHGRIRPYVGTRARGL